MHRFWKSIIRPCCEVLLPKTLVEIGTAAGLNTTNILEYCRSSGARFHAIDPAPHKNFEKTLAGLEDFGEFHRELSLNVLDHVTGDIVLIDGDHNWYTVYNELRLIEAAAKSADRPFPTIFLHDVHWPYGRRDLYYEPSRIPEEFRQPFIRQGIVLGESQTTKTGGYNYKHFNARTEGGVRNGVLTAVEDFIGQAVIEYQLRQIPGFHGLGILFSPDQIPASKLAQIEKIVAVPPEIKDHLEILEAERLYGLIALSNTYWKLGGYPGPRIARLVKSARLFSRRMK